MAAHHTGLAHHFEDMEQQRESATLGMWAFLVTEVLFFGGLFTAYTVYRFKYHLSFMAASHQLDVTLGGINTAVLIGSSLTMAMAVRAAQYGRRNGIVVYLVSTMILGGVFLGIKFVEYSHKFHEHLVPGKYFSFEGDHASNVEIFFSLYFAMTGMHALHMLVGMGLMIWLIGKTLLNRFTSEYYGPVEMFGLYWHFVDIVWIFLFPLLYLIGRH